jgi:hypothetical protein
MRQRGPQRRAGLRAIHDRQWRRGAIVRIFPHSDSGPRPLSTWLAAELDDERTTERSLSTSTHHPGITSAVAGIGKRLHDRASVEPGFASNSRQGFLGKTSPVLRVNDAESTVVGSSRGFMHARTVKSRAGLVEAMRGLEAYVRPCGLERSLVELVKVRASQIKGLRLLPRQAPQGGPDPRRKRAAVPRAQRLKGDAVFHQTRTRRVRLDRGCEACRGQSCARRRARTRPPEVHRKGIGRSHAGDRGHQRMEPAGRCFSHRARDVPPRGRLRRTGSVDHGSASVLGPEAPTSTATTEPRAAASAVIPPPTVRYL